MQLITPAFLDDTNNSEVKCFATTSGISDSDKEVIDEQIKPLYRGNIKVSMANMYCGDFFAEYWRSLSF